MGVGLDCDGKGKGDSPRACHMQVLLIFEQTVNKCCCSLEAFIVITNMQYCHGSFLDDLCLT